MVTIRWRMLFLGLVVALANFVAFIGSFGAAFALGDGHQHVPARLVALVEVLGFPLLLAPEGWFILLRPVLGDDSNILFAVAAANALLWGLGVAAIVDRIQRRRRAAEMPVRAA